MLYSSACIPYFMLDNPVYKGLDDADIPCTFPCIQEAGGGRPGVRHPGGDAPVRGPRAQARHLPADHRQARGQSVSP